jgi:hypothetical protein
MEKNKLFMKKRIMTLINKNGGKEIIIEKEILMAKK